MVAVPTQEAGTAGGGDAAGSNYYLTINLYEAMTHMPCHGLSISHRNLYGGFNARQYTSWFLLAVSNGW